MGLFQSKHHSDTKPHDDKVAKEVTNVFDEHFRDEMRSFGRQYFKRVIEENAESFKRDLDATVSQMNAELKEYMTEQLDATITQVNVEIEKQLEKRLAENDRITKDAQDLAVQSLNRNAQTLHGKYQQLSTTLEQAIAGQEAMMIGVFEENKAMMSTAQNEQESILQTLDDSARTSREQVEKVGKTLEDAVAQQETSLMAVFDESKARIEATKDVQEKALASLNDNAKALEEQYRQLNATLQKNVAAQEETLVGAFEDNMAQIIEHYLLGALGDQFDMKAQLPLIIKQMEASKQAIVDDMKL